MNEDIPLLRDGDASAHVEGLKRYATGGGGGSNPVISNHLAKIRLAADSDAILIGQQLVDMQGRCLTHDNTYAAADTSSTAQDATWTWTTGSKPADGATPAMCKVLGSGDTDEVASTLKQTLPTQDPSPVEAAAAGAYVEVAAIYVCPDQIDTAVDVHDQLRTSN